MNRLPQRSVTLTRPSRQPSRNWRLIWAAFCLLALGLPSACATTRAAGANDAVAEESDDALRERIVLSLLDGEALYTVAGGLKPVSSGFWRTSIELAQPDLGEVERVQRMLREIRGVDEQLEFGVTCFAQEHEGKRAIHAWVAHRGRVEQTLERHSEFFAPLGIGPHLECDEVLAIVERMPQLERFRAYGHLFGYPDYAVEFFVAAAAEENSTGTPPARDFAHIATYAADEHRFVWAVPRGHVENDADGELRRRAAMLLGRYRALRDRFIGNGRPGAIALLRAASRLRAASARPEERSPEEWSSGRAGPAGEARGGFEVLPLEVPALAPVGARDVSQPDAAVQQRQVAGGEAGDDATSTRSARCSSPRLPSHALQPWPSTRRDPAHLATSHSRDDVSVEVPPLARPQ